MKRKTKIVYIATVLFVAVLLLFTVLAENKAVYVSADALDEINFDNTYVMDDLRGSTVDGVPFNLKDYSFDKNKPTKIFSFVEYCYSFNATKQANYGLYVYVYNPQGINFVYDSVQNKIEFAVGEGATGYQKYSLKYLNCSTETNNEGLFIKYKVVLSEARKMEVLNALNSTNRIYRVGGIELLITGSANATDYPATGVITADNKGSIIYNYSGYSAGYGANPEAASTLTVNSTEGDVLSLEVHHTSWREKGVTNGKDEYTQDSLNSVYFAVPKTIVNKYGYLSEVHAEWRNAVTDWGLVTGNYEIYQKLYPYVGQDINFNNSAVYYSIFGGYRYGSSAIYNSIRTAKIAYNPYDLGGDNILSDQYWESVLTQLNWLFSAGDESNIADRTPVSSETLKTWYEREFTNMVGENYGETLDCKDGVKIYKALFESIDDEIINYHIKADDKYTLVSQKWSQSWWEEFFGGYHKDGVAVPVDIEAIHKVTDNDFGTDTEVTCNRLYISTSDYDQFKSFYDENKADNNVYLFRFAQTEYVSMEASECSLALAINGQPKEIDTNAYFYKQNVFLDFDIIDVTFDNGKVKTIIPVVSSPIDIFPVVTPPVNVTEDTPKPDWKRIIKIIIGVVLFVLIVVVLSYVFKAIAKLFHRKN